MRRRAEDDSERLSSFCAMYAMGECALGRPGDSCCPRGKHAEPPMPEKSKVLVCITKAKTALVQQKWEDAGGRGKLVNVWQVRNPRLEFLFRASEKDFASTLGKCSDQIDAWHGTAECNVMSIAMTGFDPKRRSGQLYGAGEYFAKDPNVSVSYSRGGSYMFLCKLLLGDELLDHTWVEDAQYYIAKQRGGRIQAMPMYLVQFAEDGGELGPLLRGLSARDVEERSQLTSRQRGGLRACTARLDAGMAAALTSHLWLGWLAPELCEQDNDAVADDVTCFLSDCDVESVVPERNGARIGAFVRLASPISKAKFDELSRRLYHGKHVITVDDQQPGNPRNAGKLCPRLAGPSRYCRGWNIHGHHAWNWGCSFDHPKEKWPTHGAKYRLEEVDEGTAKFDEISTELHRSAPFVDQAGGQAMPRVVGVKRIVNRALEKQYQDRCSFLREKHGYVVEKELWHGTNCSALPELLTHGLQPPSDTQPGDTCDRSGGKGLCTTLCGTDCQSCTEPHSWGKCHMFGLGVYLADQAQKSHRYVREPRSKQVRLGTGAVRWQVQLGGRYYDYSPHEQRTLENAYCGQSSVQFRARGWDYRVDFGRMMQVNLQTRTERKIYRTGSAQAASPAGSGERLVYSMLRCRVVIGSPYLISGNLLSADAMHDMCMCQDPSDMVETAAEDWNIAKGHDAYYVRGMGGTQKAGLGVQNSEYVVFQPYQIMPLYQVDYVLD